MVDEYEVAYRSLIERNVQVTGSRSQVRDKLEVISSLSAG